MFVQPSLVEPENMVNLPLKTLVSKLLSIRSKKTSIHTGSDSTSRIPLFELVRITTSADKGIDMGETAIGNELHRRNMTLASRVF